MRIGLTRREFFWSGLGLTVAASAAFRWRTATLLSREPVDRVIYDRRPPPTFTVEIDPVPEDELADPGKPAPRSFEMPTVRTLQAFLVRGRILNVAPKETGVFARVLIRYPRPIRGKMVEVDTTLGGAVSTKSGSTYDFAVDEIGRASCRERV